MATVEVKEYVVYPTRYEEIPLMDKYSLCLWVYDGGRWGWSVRDFPGGQGRAMNKKGEFIYERGGHGGNKFRRYKLEDALALAEKWVDERKVWPGLTIDQLIEKKVTA